MYNHISSEQILHHSDCPLTMDRILSSYRYTATCKFCNQEIPLTVINQIIEHQFQCQQYSQMKDKKVQTNKLSQIWLDEKESYEENKLTNSKQKEKKKKVIQSLLDVGKLSKGSKNLYRPALIKLFHHLDEDNLMNLSAFQLNSIVQQKCKSTNQINAINRLRKTMHIDNSLQLITTIKQQNKIIKEGIIKRPHRAWDLKFLQQFLDQLIKYQRGILAYRIYILYELAARISELTQITFQMVIQGTIIYTPIKQQKQGNQVQRKFKLSQEVSNMTKEFVEIYSIPIDSTLNIGFHKQQINSQSFHKQLKYALSLILSQNTQIQDGFQQFLELFQYHDLRYTKLTEMHKCGINDKLIQQFVKHKSAKTTQNYIQQANGEDFIDLNHLDFAQSQQQSYKSHNLILNFESTKNLSQFQ